MWSPTRHPCGVTLRPLSTLMQVFLSEDRSQLPTLRPLQSSQSQKRAWTLSEATGDVLGREAYPWGDCRNTCCMSHSGVGTVAGTCSQVAEELGLRHFSARKGMQSLPLLGKEGALQHPPGKAYQCAARVAGVLSRRPQVRKMKRIHFTKSAGSSGNALLLSRQPFFFFPSTFFLHSAVVYFSNSESKGFPQHQKFHKRNLNTLCSYNLKPWLWLLQDDKTVRTALPAL